MSDLKWAVENGDLDKVKEFIESQVSKTALIRADKAEKIHYLLLFSLFELLHHISYFVGGRV